MFSSQKKVEKLIKKLQDNQTETPVIDGKSDIVLDTDGDKAHFIRHIAALANNLQTSYLLIGVENKTWNITGLSENSPLKNSDATQQRINLILEKRLDPALHILYRTYEVDGKLIGLVIVNGNSPPYIISIDDPRYGGNKSHGKEHFVYRGVIYTRQGANSIAANRQSKVLQIASGKTDYIGVIISLIFVTAIVGAGIGVGISVLPFGDPWVAAILGFAWGLAVGWILNKRVVESLGNFFDKITIGTILKGIMVPIYGAFIGAVTSYRSVDMILRGEATVSHPVEMGLFIIPFATVILNALFFGYLYALYIVWNWASKRK